MKNGLVDIEIYRVRKGWNDFKTQAGAFFVLENAIELAKKTKQNVYNHKKEFNKEIGYKIKEIRVKKNISMEQIASRAIMVPPHITQLEKGINGMTLNKFVIICNALEISPQDVLECFLFGGKINEDLLYNKLQEEKNLSKNILEFMKQKNNGLKINN